MMTRKKLFWVGLGIVSVGIQCFGPKRTNPPVILPHTIQSQLQIPPRVSDIMNHSCMDCHSYETRWPWYSRVAPISWWLVDNVNDGRNTLNLSEWTQYKPSYALATLRAMNQVVKVGAMPLDSYSKFHPQGKLSDEERRIFCDWAQSESRRLQDALWNNEKPQKSVIQ